MIEPGRPPAVICPGERKTRTHETYGKPKPLPHAHETRPAHTDSDHAHGNGHDHKHDHKHGHGHHGHDHGPGGHSHAPATFGKAFAIGITLNIVYVALEAVFGLMSGSLALLADAGHNLSDVLGLVIAWVAATLAARPPSLTRTYGFKRAPILASLANAVILLVAVGAILIEAVHRLYAPQPVDSGMIIWVAAIGVVVNAGTAMLFMRGAKDDLNIRGAFLHMAADAGVTVGVIIAALLIGATGWLWLDPAISLAIAVVILVSTWGLLRDSLSLAMDAVPRGIDQSKVRTDLEALPGVERLHDLHIWALSTTENALTCHLFMPAGHPGDAFLHGVAEDLRTRHRIGHVTLQVEIETDQHCRLCDDRVV
ncbi:cation diffusion facilitator family transporter [Rhizobium halophytocola]|uniref:Cobalt-zinc-cadmium efflux system protein n=1 Tax=Rhizobium halophytocola TaxID=735519 RepID=A0ABS4DYZ1_9HYPH|nr:cation diffusion facilitator family transporter [Rhizobium halophytocola]MBP1850905.1 cobalt-zinc-cadmium efflux system protein [Rhizobium halophytocola]